MTGQTDQIVIADRDMLVRMRLAEAVATGNDAEHNMPAL